MPSNTMWVEEASPLNQRDHAGASVPIGEADALVPRLDRLMTRLDEPRRSPSDGWGTRKSFRTHSSDSDSLA